jgi:hypothetical protein
MKHLNKILTVALLNMTFLATPVLANQNDYAMKENTFTNVNSLSINPNYDSFDISFKSDSNENEEELKTTIFGLPQNMGPIDRSLRGVVAAGLIGTGIYGLTTGNISKEVSGVLLGVSVIPIATASTGYCPLYQLFGVKYSF